MGQKQKDKQKQRQRQEERKKKRSLHDKHRERRKKDMMIGMPFIIGYQGDPAMGMAYMYCDQVHSFKLIASRREKVFARLKRYQKKAIKSMFKLEGKILVKEAQ